jgi:hypothetical protein
MPRPGSSSSSTRTIAAFRKRFEAAAKERENELRTGFANAGVDALELATNDNLVDAILRFADLRKRRSQLATGGGLPQHLGTSIQ